MKCAKCNKVFNTTPKEHLYKVHPELIPQFEEALKDFDQQVQERNE